MQQDEWFKQQIYQNQKADEDHRKIKQKIAEQDLANYRMHCLLLAEHEQKMRDIRAKNLNYNRLLAESKKEKELEKKKKEEELDRRYYLDAEETRDFAYAHMKATIDHMKDNF